MKRKKAVSRKKKVAHKLASAFVAAAQGRGRGEDVNTKFFRLYKPRKVPITIRLDADVVEWFRADGRGYQTKINQLLRKVMEQEAGK